MRACFGHAGSTVMFAHSHNAIVIYRVAAVRILLPDPLPMPHRKSQIPLPYSTIMCSMRVSFDCERDFLAHRVPSHCERPAAMQAAAASVGVCLVVGDIASLYSVWVACVNGWVSVWVMRQFMRCLVWGGPCGRFVGGVWELFAVCGGGEFILIAQRK